MKNRFSLGILTGLLVGTLLGAAAVGVGNVASDSFAARIDAVTRSQRSNRVYQDEGHQNPGVPDARVEPRTAETRTQKTPVHGVAVDLEKLDEQCIGNVQCIINELNKLNNAQ